MVLTDTPVSASRGPVFVPGESLCAQGRGQFCQVLAIALKLLNTRFGGIGHKCIDLYINGHAILSGNCKVQYAACLAPDLPSVTYVVDCPFYPDSLNAVRGR